MSDPKTTAISDKEAEDIFNSGVPVSDDDADAIFAQGTPEPEPAAPAPAPVKPKGPTRETHPWLYGDVKRQKVWASPKAAAAGHGFLKGVPLMQKALAGVETLKEGVVELAGGAKSQSYDENLRDLTKESDKSYNENSWSFRAGSLAGTSAAAMVTAPMGMISQGAALGAGYELSDPDTDLVSKEGAKAAVKGAAVGAATSAAIKGVSHVAGKAVKGATQKYRMQIKEAAKTAESRALRELGYAEGHAKRAAKKGLEYGNLDETINWLKTNLSDPLETTVSERAAQARTLFQNASDEIGSIIKGADEALPNGVDPLIVKQARQEFLQNTPSAGQVSSRKKAVKEFTQTIKDWSATGKKVTVNDLFEISKRAAEKARNAADDGIQAVQLEVKELADSIVDKYITPEAREQLINARRNMAIAGEAKEALGEKVQQLSKPDTRPVWEAFKGGAGQIADATWEGTKAVFRKTQPLHKLAKSHEAKLAAEQSAHHTFHGPMDKIITGIATGAVNLGKYSGQLLDALARGRAPLAATIYTLTRSDPEFRQKMKELEDADEK